MQQAGIVFIDMLDTIWMSDLWVVNRWNWLRFDWLGLYSKNIIDIYRNL